MTIRDEISEVEELFKKHQSGFQFQIVTDLLNSEKVQMKWGKKLLKDRFREDKNILTLNLYLQGLSTRKIGAFCGISHGGVSVRLRKAVSMLKARYPGMDIWNIREGEEEMNVTLNIDGRFCASHTLVGHPGPCGTLHGHTWKVCLKISGKPDPITGILVDFHSIKKMMKEILPDHRHLNDIKGLSVPTAENLSAWLYEQFILEIAEISRGEQKDLELVSVTVWESPEASATYTGD